MFNFLLQKFSQQQLNKYRPIIEKINNLEQEISILSDVHLQQKTQEFKKAIKSCFSKAEKEDCLITLGIPPHRPDTGYGYIQYIDSPGKEKDARIKKVKKFTEKPSLEIAKSFL